MRNSFLFIILFFVILFRGNIINFVNNVSRLFVNYNDSLEVNYLNSSLNKLRDEYNRLLDFKNNIDLKDNYIVTNVYRNNYGFNKLIINGDNYHINDEVIGKNGLIGIITKINNKYSEITYIYDLNIPVSINGNLGKIVGKDSDNNLIIREINNVNLNDLVYSVNMSYIGRVIDVKLNDLDCTLVVKTSDFSNLDYVIVKEV